MSIFMINLIWTVFNVCPMLFALRLAVNRPAKKFSGEVVCRPARYVQFDTEPERASLRILRLSDTSLTVRQDERRILLTGEPLEFTLQGSRVRGTVTRSVNGLATIEVDSPETDAYLHLLSIYADNLKPFYDLDNVLEQRNALLVAERGLSV